MDSHEVSASVVVERQSAMQHAMVVCQGKVSIFPLVLVEILFVVELGLQKFVKLSEFIFCGVVIARVIRHLIRLFAFVLVFQSTAAQR